MSIGGIPGPYPGAVGAVVGGRIRGGDTQNLQIAPGRDVRELDAVMGGQPAQRLPRWLFILSGSAACGRGTNKPTAK